MVLASRESTIVISVGWIHYFIEFHHRIATCHLPQSLVITYFAIDFPEA